MSYFQRPYVIYLDIKRTPRGRCIFDALTLQEIAKKYDVHPNQISLWKKQVIENLPEIFERPNKKTEGVKLAEEHYDEALKTIGTMKIENEFLKKSTNNCTEPIRSD